MMFKKMQTSSKNIRRKIKELCVLPMLCVMFTFCLVGKVYAYDYALMNEVYPFTPPEEILDEVDMLLQQENDVCIAIMPITSNENYPSFYEFAKVMQYAQEKGCHLLLHFPLLNIEKPIIDDVTPLIDKNIELFRENGIIIQGILYEGNSVDDELFQDLKDRYEVYGIRDDELTKLLINGKPYELLDTEFIPKVIVEHREITIPEEYDYHRNVIDDISFSLLNTNKVLMLIVSFAIVIFVLMIIYARKWMYSRFVGKKHKKGNE